ncbi:hypothetical protein ACOZB2_24180 [Pantoea endophytica]
MPIDAAHSGKTNSFFLTEIFTSGQKTRQGDKIGTLTQQQQSEHLNALSRKPGLNSGNPHKQQFWYAAIQTLALVMNTQAGGPDISPARTVGCPSDPFDAYQSTSSKQYVSALIHAGAVMRSEPAGSGYRVKHPVSLIPAKVDTAGAPLRNEHVQVEMNSQASLTVMPSFKPGTDEYIDALRRAPTKSAALSEPTSRGGLEIVKVFELRIANDTGDSGIAKYSPFYLSLRDGYFYRALSADVMGEGPYALRQGSTDTLVRVDLLDTPALSAEEKANLLTSVGVPGPHHALFDTQDTPERKPLPPVVNQLWIGVKKIPEKVLRIVSANHKKMARAPSALKHIIYLSSRNAEAFKYNRMELKRAAPGAEIVELETSPFMKSFQQWKGGEYAQLAREHERLADLGEFGPAFQKDVLMLGILATHDTGWHGGGMYLDLDSRIVGAFTPENLSTAPDAPLVGRLSKTLNFGDSTFVCNDALGVHEKDPFPENVLALASKYWAASPVPPMDDVVKASKSAKQDYFIRLAKTSAGPELFTETMMTTPITGPLLQFALMPYRYGVMPETQERNRFFKVQTFVQTQDGENNSWG